MPFNTNILPEKIQRLKEKFEQGNFADVLVGAVNVGNGLMQERIFEINEDVEGQNFGEYVGKKKKTKLILTGNRTTDKRAKAIVGLDLTAYQQKRARAGRQTNPKDLEFSGNLRRFMVTGAEDEKSAVIKFANEESAQIAKGQENQITNIRLGKKATTKGAGIKIFRLNQQEKEETVSQGLELIKQEMKR